MKRSIGVCLLLILFFSGCAGSGMGSGASNERLPSKPESSNDCGETSWPENMPNSGIDIYQKVESEACPPDAPLVSKDEPTFEYRLFEPSDGLLESISQMDDAMIKQQMGRLGMFRMGNCLIYYDHTAYWEDRERQIQYYLLDTGEEGTLLSTRDSLFQVYFADKSTVMLDVYDSDTKRSNYFKFNILTGEIVYVQTTGTDSIIFHNNDFYSITASPIPFNEFGKAEYQLYDIQQLLPDGLTRSIVKDVSCYYFYDNELYYASSNLWPPNTLRAMNLETRQEKELFKIGSACLLAVDGNNVAYANSSGITISRLEDGVEFFSEQADLSTFTNLDWRELSERNIINNNRLSIYKDVAIVFSDDSRSSFPMSYLYYINKDGTFYKDISDTAILNYCAIDDNLYVLKNSFEDGVWKTWIEKKSLQSGEE